VQVLTGAFAFKSLASAVTVYTITTGTAIELAPASSILIAKFGVLSGSILVNLVWLSAVAASLWLIKVKIRDSKVRQFTLELALLFTIGVTAFDGLWDLGVLLEFNEIYVVSITILSISVISIFALWWLKKRNEHAKGLLNNINEADRIIDLVRRE
jgi:hypothetical protein